MSQIVPKDQRATSITQALDGARAQVMALLADTPAKHKERFLAIALEAASRPEVANCSPLSIVKAVLRGAQLGLPVDNIHAAIVPYGSDATFQPMWQGLVSTVRKHGGVKKVWASVVFDGDKLVWREGLHPDLIHEPCGERRMEKATHAYACALLPDGELQFVVLTKADVLRVKARARGGAWKTDEIEQWKKTAVKNLCKYLERNPEVSAVLQADEDAERVADYEVVQPSDATLAVMQASLPVQPVQEPARKSYAEQAVTAARVTICGLECSQHDWGAVAPQKVNSKHPKLKDHTYGDLVEACYRDQDALDALQGAVADAAVRQEKGEKVSVHVEFAAMALDRSLNRLSPAPESVAQEGGFV